MEHLLYKFLQIMKYKKVHLSDILSRSCRYKILIKVNLFKKNLGFIPLLFFSSYTQCRVVISFMNQYLSNPT